MFKNPPVAILLANARRGAALSVFALTTPNSDYVVITRRLSLDDYQKHREYN